MAIIHGTIPTLTATRRVRDSAAGNAWEQEWVGSVSGIAALAATLIAAGARVRDESQAGVGRLLATFAADPDNPTAEQAIDRYEFEMEPIQVSLFNVPAVAIEGAAYAAANSGGVALYRQQIQDAAQGGAVYPFDSALYPYGAEVYRLLSQGVESYELKRPTLSRVRSFSPNFSGRVVLSAVETVYTTAALVRDFEIPATVASQLPANPDETPTGTAWAWKLRGDRSVYIPQLNRIEETRDWVFAAWSTLLYIVQT